jgi:hypothetical protein
MKMPQVKILHKTLIVAFGLMIWPSYASAHLVTTLFTGLMVAAALHAVRESMKGMKKS